MTYIFEDFVEFSNMKREDYIKELKEEAKELPLSSIIEKLDLDELGRDIAEEKNHRFKKGNPISFSIRPVYINFDISVYPDKTEFNRDGSEIRTYTGESAVNFYDALFKKIEKAIKERDDIPF